MRDMRESQSGELTVTALFNSTLLPDEIRRLKIIIDKSDQEMLEFINQRLAESQQEPLTEEQKQPSITFFKQIYEQQKNHLEALLLRDTQRLAGEFREFQKAVAEKQVGQPQFVAELSSDRSVNGMLNGFLKRAQEELPETIQSWQQNKTALQLSLLKHSPIIRILLSAQYLSSREEIPASFLTEYGKIFDFDIIRKSKAQQSYTILFNIMKDGLQNKSIIVDDNIIGERLFGSALPIANNTNNRGVDDEQILAINNCLSHTLLKNLSSELQLFGEQVIENRIDFFKVLYFSMLTGLLDDDKATQERLGESLKSFPIEDKMQYLTNIVSLFPTEELLSSIPQETHKQEFKNLLSQQQSQFIETLVKSQALEGVSSENIEILKNHFNARSSFSPVEGELVEKKLRQHR